MPLLRDSSDERAREGVGRRECCRSVRAADRLNRRSPREEAHCHGRMLSIDRRWSVRESIDRSFRRLFAIRLEAVAAGDRQRPMMMMLLLLLLSSTNDRSVRETTTTTTTTTRRKLSTSADRPRARRGGAARRAGSATRAAARTARARPRSPRAARSARPSGATRLSR